MIHNKYNEGLEKNEANFAALTPVSLLSRAAEVYPENIAIIYEEIQFTWKQVYQRSVQMASALSNLGLGEGDTVAVLAPNIPAIFEAHYGIPMAGCVINTLNTRLDANTIAFMLDHGEAKVLIVDYEFFPVAEEAVKKLGSEPYIIVVHDEKDRYKNNIGDVDYEDFLESGNAEYSWRIPSDEWDAIALSYTSGTTGNPKGVVTHHRGAYLNAVGNVLTWAMPHFPKYLWTLPMFHCNGWCFPWSLAVVAGTSVCLRKVDAENVFELIRKHKVTHFCAAPVVHNALLNAPASLREGIEHEIKAMIAGSAPPQKVMEASEGIGIELTHIYGLTEVYGPAAVCVKQPKWLDLSSAERARLNGRQGVRYVVQEGMDVVDPNTMASVPRDGVTIGEIVFKGNIVMKGYLKNIEATEKAFEGGWYRTGDLAVIDDAGYVKIKDRSKDIIISGGENISTIEIEDVLYSHPAVLEAAVVACKDDKWGEVPCAFVTLKDGLKITQDVIIDHCRSRLARFKLPKRVIFGPLPKTSTGKIQKATLRERLNIEAVAK